MNGCASSLGPGYIAVGTYDQFGLAAEVYVVYTDPNGAAYWEMTYDVQGQGYEDEGMALVEVNGGFVILSNVRKQGGGPWMPALTFIKCHGGVVWSQVYPDVAAGLDLRGNDLIQLPTGEPAVGTSPGDLAVAGSWFNGATEDAFLMRTDANGNLIWNVTHDTSGDEAFNALTEAIAPGIAAAADIVAVGRFNKVGGDLQGLVARVSGNTGTQIAIPHCMAQPRPGRTASAMRSTSSVITLRDSPNYAGQFAIIGTSSNPAWGDDVWLTRGNPCAIFAQSRIGDPAQTVTSEHGNDLREIVGSVPGGILLGIAGDHAAPGATYDATFLQVGTGNLVPLGGTGRLFGSAGNGDEIFFSLAQDLVGGPNFGWILAGRTQTDWQGVLDPQDLYLVHYNPLAAPACEVKWAPSFVLPTWPAVKLGYRLRAPARHYQVLTPETPQWNPWLICP